MEIYWSIVLECLRTIPLFVLKSIFKGNRVVLICLEDILSQYQMATAEIFAVIYKDRYICSHQ